MNLKFSNKKITGLLGIVPAREVSFDDGVEHYNFSVAQSMKLKKVMGYDKRRIVQDSVCVSDLCIDGLAYLFEKGLLEKDDIDALILVTQTPDFLMPPTSNIIQGHFRLKEDMICMDINQGCAGFIIGLIQAFMLLEQDSVNKVVLLNADIMSRKVSSRDRNSHPLVGDAASITIIEKSELENLIYANLKMDGQYSDALQIPAGGLRLPISSDTSEMKVDPSGNYRSSENLYMKGDLVFNFVQNQVPSMIESLFSQAGEDISQADFFLFHQPNRFILEKLADALSVNREKMPANLVESYGNSSGVTIPILTTLNLGAKLVDHVYKTCFAGFGVGLTWGSMLLDFGHLDFCQLKEY